MVKRRNGACDFGAFGNRIETFDQFPFGFEPVDRLAVGNGVGNDRNSCFTVTVFDQMHFGRFLWHDHSFDAARHPVLCELSGESLFRLQMQFGADQSKSF